MPAAFNPNDNSSSDPTRKRASAVTCQHASAQNPRIKRCRPVTTCQNAMAQHPADEQCRVVKVIQTWWSRLGRELKTSSLVKKYLAQGPTIEHVKAISFEQLVVFLREKSVIAAAKASLQRIHLLCTFRHGSPFSSKEPATVNVRVFLAAFMIAYRPTRVFESMGSLEQSLLESALPLLERFEKICLKLQSSPFSVVPHDLTADFPSMLHEYLKRFKAWKVPDEAKLTCRIKHALVALYQAEEHLPADEPVDSKLKVEFRTQIERLRSKLQQIAGAQALRAFDEERGKTPSSAQAQSGGQGQASASAGAYSALPGRMTNEQLAHELLLDPTFQLDENGGCSVENPVYHRIRESFHQAFWDSLVDDLKLTPPCYVRVLRVLGEIRDGIMELAGSRESASVSEAIDLDHIKLQAEKGLYWWESCVRLVSSVVDVIKRVQAPKRDEETTSKWQPVKASLEEASAAEQPSMFCKALEFLLDRVNAMRIDAANARLRLIAPVIKDHGIDYERGKLQDKLNDGSLTLERTQAWIRRTLKAELAANNIQLDSILDGRASAFVSLHTAAMLALVTDSEGIKTETSPETLLFDVYRLSLIQNEYRYCSLAATMLVTVAHGLAGRRDAADSQALASISAMLASEDRQLIDAEQMASDIAKILEGTTLTVEARQTVGRALEQCADPSTSVHQLMSKRLRSLWGKIVQEGSVPSDVQPMSAAKCLIPRLDKAASKLRAVGSLNRAVHLAHYNRIIAEEAAALSPS